MMYKKNSHLIWLLGPALIVMVVFLYYPFVMNIINSLYDVNGLGASREIFIGFENYRKLAADKEMFTSVKNTGIMMVCTVVFQVGIGLALAVCVDAVRRGKEFFKTVFFFPIVISATAIGLLFNLFYAYYGGMFNQILTALNKAPINWKSDSLALLMIILPIVWSYAGFYFVLIFTGISNIPSDIFESALLDGAVGWKKFRYITFPLLKGVIGTCVTLAVTGSLKVFDLAWVIAPRGAPKGSTHFMGTYMYETTFIEENIDYGASIALIIVIIGVVVSQIANRLFRDKEMKNGNSR
ncbi:carbohydrate ABC transporter membrane protein 1 (CUT1 family) [Kineothrix alysoides]|uniref:Carbohydrate ABC transporter membrane protein 1 (CUT1 family) n=1 Tax=Kineothrix alysoides TaxID=1469948 RepID=A0A4R1R3V2_9FIRM|nr:sugar ABC transporter permease [Kineothrix alysoides]TCL60113.1 carbohydrate ABC transporter membrane protein 1 (CUT1 family) [Kineothrix alysoides]